MVFKATRDIKAGEQLFYSYCSLTQSAAERKEELAPYGIAQCICAACVNATPETDTLRMTFNARSMEYKRQSKIWAERGRLPVGTLGELLRLQRAVVNEGFETHDSYLEAFIPALAIAFQVAGMPREAQEVVQKLFKWSDLLGQEKALRGSE